MAEAQVRETSIRQNVEALFATAEQAGMTVEEFESYRQDVNDMILEAETEQTERNARLAEKINSMRKKALRELQGEVKGELKRLYDEEHIAYKATDTYRAWDKIHNGISLNGKKIFFKLTEGELRALGYTAKQIDELHKAKLAVRQTRKGSLPIGDLAVQLNYSDAKALVDDLLAHLYPKEEIKQRAADRFVKENPELATPQQIQDVAATSIFNKAKMKVLKVELQAFLRMARKQNKEIDVEALQTMAEQAVSLLKYEDIKPQHYIVEANRAKREPARHGHKAIWTQPLGPREEKLAMRRLPRPPKKHLPIGPNRKNSLINSRRRLSRAWTKGTSNSFKELWPTWASSRKSSCL